MDNIKYLGKKDCGKEPINLIPTQIIRDVAIVREFGNKKYSPYSWVTIEKERYVAALMRHLLAYMDDPNSIDEESGIPHYKHAACNMAFICEMERKDWDTIKQNLINRDPELLTNMKNSDKPNNEQKVFKVKIHRKKDKSNDCNRCKFHY